MDVKTLIWRINTVKMNEISQSVYFALCISLFNTKPKCYNFTSFSQILTELTIFIKHHIRDFIVVYLSWLMNWGVLLFHLVAAW
jgi:hypothetical protein